MTRAEIIGAIKVLSVRFSKPLSDEDYADGWTDASRMDVLRYLQNVECDLQNGVDVSFFSLVRALDGMGISKGDLLEEACRVNNAVNALKR